MVLVNGEGTANQAGSQDWGVNRNQLPHGRVVVREDFQLGVEVQVQKNEASEGGSGVTAGHGLETVVDLLSVSSTNLAGVVDVLKASRTVAGLGNTGVVGQCNVWPAYREEVWSKPTDQPLHEDLKHSCPNERIEKPKDRVVAVPERSNAELHAEEDEDGDEGSEKSGSPDGDDFIATRCLVSLCNAWVDQHSNVLTVAGRQIGGTQSRRLC